MDESENYRPLEPFIPPPAAPVNRAKLAADEARARDAARLAEAVERENYYLEIQSAFSKISPADFARKQSAAKEAFPILKILDRPRGEMGIGAMMLILKSDAKEPVTA
jgi:hypothetical protein